MICPSQLNYVPLMLGLVPLALLYAHSGQVASLTYMNMASHKPTVPVLKAGHPSVLCFVCIYVYMLCMGGGGGGLSMLLGWVPFFLFSFFLYTIC